MDVEGCQLIRVNSLARWPAAPCWRADQGPLLRGTERWLVRSSAVGCRFADCVAGFCWGCLGQRGQRCCGPGAWPPRMQSFALVDRSRLGGPMCLLAVWRRACALLPSRCPPAGREHARGCCGGHVTHPEWGPAAGAAEQEERLSWLWGAPPGARFSSIDCFPGHELLSDAARPSSLPCVVCLLHVALILLHPLPPLPADAPATHPVAVLHSQLRQL